MPFTGKFGDGETGLDLDSLSLVVAWESKWRPFSSLSTEAKMPWDSVWLAGGRRARVSEGESELGAPWRTIREERGHLDDDGERASGTLSWASEGELVELTEIGPNEEELLDKFSFI